MFRGLYLFLSHWYIGLRLAIEVTRLYRLLTKRHNRFINF